MRHLRMEPVDACSRSCPEYAEMVAFPPVDERDHFLCQRHRQWWRAVLSPDPDPVTGEQALRIEPTDRPPQVLTERATLLERLPR